MVIVDFIRTWIIDIVIMFIFISIVELVLPNGNMKKYINMIVGLLIIFTIINPFIKLFNIDLNLDKAVFNQISQQDIAINEDKEFLLNQEKQVAMLYEEKIRREIIELVEVNTTFKISEMNIDINTDEDDYGNIALLELVIEEKQETIEDKNKIVIKEVKPIIIGEKSVHKKDYKKSDNDEEIKELISQKYNLEKENILVFIKTEGEGE
ncbi:stage III sporulation protein AF [Tissierella sp. MSJ-40]|uniref:Stage III sporulation protein AF n=1 Tax=Tissierella simiarum TaxID=2841534 RepID=A0ABS6E457_9FIRM|nr:stage III sporulation protein AF [Tissierella simiarum]MBU5437547.1 stage III sporulation protein AF [Tissierella simiarum]